MENKEDFAGTFYSNLRSLITLVDHLRDAGLQKYIKLPRIVTLGLQSSGKSSVLESIVGLNFLPRSEGVCTRRPLELRLVHEETQTQPWAIFEGNSNKYTEFEKVREQIERLTDDRAGRNKGIVDDPIILTIHSSTCPDLTLIDLPGITRIPLKNSDQPADIERITKEMAYRYISDPRTIILCVIAANTDISTSESLLMANKVDKAGIRTLGVITKIDIMDRGTNAKKVIMGQEVTLRLGFIGVKNRSQEDINNNVKVGAALREEQEYFAQHPVYSTMPPGYLGTDVLTQRLTQILFNHIKHFLPEILKETMYRIKDCDERSKDLGPSTPVEPKQKTQMLWNMITDYCETFKNTIRGKFERRGNSRIAKDLAGGVTIKHYFNTLLEDYSGNYNATEDYSNEEIQRIMAQHEGDNIPGFPSVDVLLFLLHPQLERLKGPVLDCLNDVHSYLDQLSRKIIERVFYRFPSLVAEIGDISSHVLIKERENCKTIVEELVDAEEGYIFTNDVEYLAKRTDLIPKSDNKVPKTAESLFVDEIRSRIDTYFRIVVRNVRDTVPKIIGYFLVRSVMDKMQMQLYESINRSETVLNLLSEPAHISTERENIRKQLSTLRKAEKILKHDPNLALQANSIEDEISKIESEASESGTAKKKADEDSTIGQRPSKTPPKGIF
ncbi:unnamed protein product [Blepharisma stoltei]|uniref:Uncharacterized protein n=1 Tax=Blepharisma stoltei TaxID=1481888 RepID=A0AAU9K7V1_9CILI|nr:unnamed protein product [Blepharisma stoltei]